MNRQKSVDQPAAADVRTELDRIFSSAAFRKSPQLISFLRFVVNEELAGHGDRIKAYTIAADALGRDSSFDPQNDPIVRVEAGRLRRALDHHYANGGSDDPIIIDMPRGGYVPTFRANGAGRRALGGMHRRLRQALESARDNYRLVLMIFTISIVVSLGFDMLAIVIKDAILPAIETAWNSAPPADAPFGATGSIRR